MEIKLSNIEVNEAESSKSIAFTADLIIKGQHAATIFDDGKGKLMRMITTPGKTDLVSSAREFLGSQRKEAKTEKGLSTVIFSLEIELNKQFRDHYRRNNPAGFQKRLQQVSEKSIVYGHPNSWFKTFDLDQSIEKMLKNDSGAKQLSFFVLEIKKALKPGQVILNTNIPKQILEASQIPVLRHTAHAARERKSAGRDSSTLSI